MRHRPSARTRPKSRHTLQVDVCECGGVCREARIAHSASVLEMFSFTDVCIIRSGRGVFGVCASEVVVCIRSRTVRRSCHLRDLRRDRSRLRLSIPGRSGECCATRLVCGRSGTKNSKYLVSSMAKAKAAARRPRLNRMLNRASGRPDCRSHRAQHRPFARWADAVSRLLNTDRFAFDHLHLRLFGCIPSARVVCVVSFGYFPNTTYRTSIVPRAAAGDHVRCGAAATREQSCGTSLSLSMMFASSLYRLSVSSYGSHTVSSGTSLTTRSTAKPMPRPELLP